jgi:hypothetical protein
MFLERVSVAMEDWAEANRGAIGDRWFRQIVRESKKYRGRDDPPIPTVIGFALWCFNTVSQFGVLAGIGPSKVNLQGIPPQLDERSTRRLLLLCASCLSLQYLVLGERA